MTTIDDVLNDTPEGAPPMPTTMSKIKRAELRDIRRSNGYQKLRTQFRYDESNKWIDGRMGAPCWLCGKDIDYRLEYPHPLSWSLDHAVTVKERPELIMDRNNFRSSHHDCNQERGTDDPKLDIGIPSEIW